MKLRRWRWRALIGLVVLLLGVGAAYYQLTRPERLRATVERALLAAGLRVADLGSVTFSPRAGLEVTGLEVVPREREPDAAWPGHTVQSARLRVASAGVRCKLLPLLTGGFHPTDIVLRGATVTLVRETAADASQMRRTGPADVRAWVARLARVFSTDLPHLRLEQIDVQLFEQGRTGSKLARRWLVDVTGAWSADSARPEYVVRVRRTGAGPQEAALGELRWRGAQVDARLDWMNIGTAALLFPDELREVSGQLGADGRVRVNRLVVGEPGTATTKTPDWPDLIRHATLEFRDVRFAVPVEEKAAVAHSSDRFLQVTQAQGTLALADGRASLALGGQVNAAPATFTLTAQLSPPSPSSIDDTTNGAPVAASRWETLRSARTAVELRIERIAFPTAEEHLSFVESPRLSPAVRSFFRDFRPRGACNVRLTATRRGAATATVSGDGAGAETGPVARWHVAGEVEALGARACYFRFPYDIEEVRGTLRFSPDGIKLDGLHGRHGLGRIHVDGRLNHSASWTGLDLTARGAAIALNAALYAALPPRYRDLWDSTAPVGLGDVHVTFHRPEGSSETGPQPLEVKTDARLLAGSLSAGSGRRLTRADGLITIAHELVRVHDLHGYLDGAAVRLDGTIAPTAGAPLSADLHVEAADVAINQSVDAAATPAPTETDPRPVPPIHFAGQCDVWGRFCGSGPFDAGAGHHTIQAKDGWLTSFEPGVRWEHVRGWIVATRGYQRVLALAADQPGAWLDAAGTLHTGAARDQPVELRLHAGSDAMDRLVRQVVPGRWARIGAALGLGGRGRLSVQIEAESTAPTGAGHVAEIRLEAERMKPEPVPLDLHEVSGHATLRRDGFELHSATACCGDDGELRVSGHGEWHEDRHWSDFSVEARDLELCPDLVAAMPGGVGRWLEQLAPQGRLDAAFERLRIVSADGQTWGLTGRLALAGASLQLVLPLTEFDGTLTGSCAVAADGQVGVAATFALSRGHVAERPFENLTGRLRRTPGERWLQLRDLSGHVCGGQVLGSAAVDVQTDAYELSFTLHDLALEELLRRKDKAHDGVRRGRLDGRVFLRGKIGDQASRRGGGELRIRGAAVVRTPVLASVARASRAVNRSLGETVELMEWQFGWEGSELKLDRVEIQARDLRLIGEGRWNMHDDTLEMTLFGANPRNWPRVSVLTDLAESAGQELLQYRVTGTAADPQVAIEPLHVLTEPLRRLLARTGR